MRLTSLLTFTQLYPLSRSEAVVEPIHFSLGEKSLLPEEHLMDLGYVTAGHLVSSQENYGIELIGPVRNDPTWQAKHHPKFANSNFQIDWDKQVAICPRGHQSQTWTKKTDKKGQPIINIRFSQFNCSPCPSRSRCTRAKTEPRGLTIHPQQEYIALHSVYPCISWIKFNIYLTPCITWK